MGGIWGQTRCSGDRAFDPPGLTEPRSAGRGRLRHEDIGTGTSPRYGDRHGVTVIRITGLFMTVLWSRYVQCLYFFEEA